MIHLVISESPIPEKALFDDMKLFDVRQEKTNQIVELNFREGSVNWFLAGKGMDGTRSLSQSPNPFPYEIAGGSIKGKIEARSDPAGGGGGSTKDKAASLRRRRWLNRGDCAPHFAIQVAMVPTAHCVREIRCAFWKGKGY